MQSGTIYFASRGISPLAIFIYGILVCTVIPLLSIAYSIAIWFTPLIYINFVLTALFGIILGFTVYPIIKWGLVRSYTYEFGIILLVWLTAMYFSWVAHLALFHNTSGELIGYTLSDANFSLNTFLTLLINPIELFRDVAIISKYGLWSIGSIPFKDVALWIIWFLEAVIILAAMWKINGKWGIYPFSDRENKWHEKQILKNKLPVRRGFNLFIEGIKNNDLECFFKIPLAQKDERQFTEIVIYATQSDPVSYISFYNQILKRDKNGRYVVEYKRSSHFYSITESQKKRLINHFS